MATAPVNGTAPAEKFTRNDVQNNTGKRAAPEEVKRIMLGACSVTLKVWADGSHSIELGQKNHKTGEWDNVGFGLHLSPSVISAISALQALGLKREAE